MSDPLVDRWRLHGKVFLWRFVENRRNFPGWDCTADAEGCESLIELFALMADARWSSSKQIVLSPTTGAIAALPGDRTGKRWVSPSKLRIVFPKGKVADHFWQWDGNLQSPTLTIGKLKLEALQDAFTFVAAHQGDFCIHADDQKRHGFDPEKMAIWFW